MHVSQFANVSPISKVYLFQVVKCICLVHGDVINDGNEDYYGDGSKDDTPNHRGCGGSFQREQEATAREIFIQNHLGPALAVASLISAKSEIFSWLFPKCRLFL